MPRYNAAHLIAWALGRDGAPESCHATQFSTWRQPACERHGRPGAGAVSAAAVADLADVAAEPDTRPAHSFIHAHSGGPVCCAARLLHRERERGGEIRIFRRVCCSAHSRRRPHVARVCARASAVGGRGAVVGGSGCAACGLARTHFCGVSSSASARVRQPDPAELDAVCSTANTWRRCPTSGRRRRCCCR